MRARGCRIACNGPTADRYSTVAHFEPLTGAQSSQPKNWKKIAEYLTDRSDMQCQHRWQKVLNPELVKGPWSAEARIACKFRSRRSARRRIA